jgi:hypothetical protein
MSVSPVPSMQPILDGQPYNVDLNWLAFFSDLFNGDQGTDWIPTFVSLGSTGTPTITGRYYRIGQNLVFFRIRIVPATNTTSTAATTYCDNFPLSFSSDSVCLVSAGSGAVQGIGGIRSADKRIYPPGWSASTETLTILGFAEAR